MKKNSNFMVKRIVSTVIFMWLFVVTLISCLWDLLDADYHEYKESYDYFYEHQLNYLMSEPIEADDKYDEENLCKIIWVTYTPIGEAYVYDGKDYYDEYQVNIYNNSDEEVGGIVVEMPYVNTLGERRTKTLTCEGVDAKSYATGNILLDESVFVYDYALVKTDDCIFNAICYTWPASESELTEEEAQKYINKDLIIDIIGEKVEPKTTSELIDNAQTDIIVTVFFFICLSISIIKLISATKKIKTGELEICKDDDVVLVLDEDDDEDTYDDEDDEEEQSKPLPSDFDDGHETSHNCGGFEIDPDAYKIDPNDY